MEKKTEMNNGQYASECGNPRGKYIRSFREYERQGGAGSREMARGVGYEGRGSQSSAPVYYYGEEEDQERSVPVYEENMQHHLAQWKGVIRKDGSLRPELHRKFEETLSRKIKKSQIWLARNDYTRFQEPIDKEIANRTLEIYNIDERFVPSNLENIFWSYTKYHQNSLIWVTKTKALLMCATQFDAKEVMDKKWSWCQIQPIAKGSQNSRNVFWLYAQNACF